MMGSNPLRLLFSQDQFIILILVLFLFLLLFWKVKRGENIKESRALIYRVAEATLMSAIPVLISAYYYSVMNTFPIRIPIAFYGAAATIAIATILMEAIKLKSPLLEEIEELKVNKIITKVAWFFVELIPAIFSVIIFFSLIILIKFPTNIILIETIANVALANMIIIVFDVALTPLIAIINTTRKVEKQAKKVNKPKNGRRVYNIT